MALKTTIYVVLFACCFVAVVENRREFRSKIKLAKVYVHDIETLHDSDSHVEHNHTSLPEKTAKMFHRYGYPIIWTIGVVCNLLSLILWLQPRLRNSTACYFAAIATVDIIVLTLYFVHSMEFGFNLQTVNHPVFCQVFNVLLVGGQYCSVLLVLAMTVDRFIVVWFPLRRLTMCSIRRTRKVIVLVVIVSHACATLEIFMWSYNPHDIHCKINWQTHTDSVHHISPLAIANLFMFCLCSTLPIIASMIINSMIIYKIRQTQLKRRLFSSESRESDITPTLTLLGVSSYFIISEFFAFVSYILHFVFRPGNASVPPSKRFLDTDWNRYHHYLISNLAIEMFSVTSYALNMFLFSLTGKRFRQALRAKLCCREERSSKEFTSVGLVSFAMSSENRTTVDAISTAVTLKDDRGIKHNRNFIKEIL
ncbi:putative G-protein coupled receptor 139 [Tubulanus polymorphus]|uniref:putative G-protein coupled receptor 139 n=1 Tax=Tubulanus polymorphus TaxID=672921 RepID=UPI003DA4B3CF